MCVQVRKKNCVYLCVEIILRYQQNVERFLFIAFGKTVEYVSHRLPATMLRAPMPNLGNHAGKQALEQRRQIGDKMISKTRQDEGGATV